MEKIQSRVKNCMSLDCLIVGFIEMIYLNSFSHQLLFELVHHYVF